MESLFDTPIIDTNSFIVADHFTNHNHQITYEEFREQFKKQYTAYAATHQHITQHTGFTTTPKSIPSKPIHSTPFDSNRKFSVAGMMRIIQGAIKVLEEYGWCQEALAQDSRGISIPLESNLAVSFCAEGALLRSTYNVTKQIDPNDHLTWAAIQYLRNMVTDTINSSQVLTSYNDDDNTTKEDIILLFKRGVESLGGMLESGFEEIHVSPRPESPAYITKVATF